MRTLTPLAAAHAARDWQGARDILTGNRDGAIGARVRAYITPAELRTGIDPDVWHGWWSYQAAAMVREMFTDDSLGQRVELAIWRNHHPAPPRGQTVTEACDFVPCIHADPLPPASAAAVTREYQRRAASDNPGPRAWRWYCRLAILREAGRE